MKLNGTGKKAVGAAVAFLLTLTMATSVALAQGPGFGRGPGHGGGMGPGGGGLGLGPGLLRGMLAAALDLTDAQKEEIRTIMEQTRTANQTILDQLKPIREQELAAVKAGKGEAELRSLANSAAPLMTQLHASNLIAHSKVYQVLTPEQREKLEKLRGEAQGRGGNFMQGRGRRF